MNKSDKAKIERAGRSVLLLWKELIDKSNGDCWYEVRARQAYQDSINAMKAAGLISNYNLDTCTVVVCDNKAKKSLTKN